MTKKFSRTVKAGLPPGSLIHIGEKRSEKTRITIIDYNKEKFEEKVVKNVEECFQFKSTSSVTWINIDGVHDPEIIRALGEHFGFHPLLLEDIMNTQQRPKMEDYGDYLFIVLKMMHYHEREHRIRTEQISLIVTKYAVISFQEEIGDVFDVIRNRIKNTKGKIRSQGPDYLAYSIIDALVDSYFAIIEKLGEYIEEVEDEVITEPTRESSEAVHRTKRLMLVLRKSVWPLREVISSLERSSSPLIKNNTKFYLRDVYDHAVQIIETIESDREILSGLIEVYLTVSSNKMNEIMKVLTIMGTIFIPLTFISGVYGMNFEFMPELGWKYGYFMALGVMAAVSIVLVAYFRKKGWV